MALNLADEAEAPRLTRAVQWLIAINVAVFFLQITVVGSHNMVPALGFEAQDLSRSPWTIVSYMFVHSGFLHILLNMYMLFVFGPRVENVWSSAEFTKFYLVCGLGGWLLHVAFVRDGTLVGASAAVLGVTLAYATRWPDDEVLLLGVIPLKVKWMVVLLAAMNVLGGMVSAGGGGVAYLAHVGGLGAAWLYLRSGSGGAALNRLRQRVSPIPDLPDETPRAVPRSMPRNRERRGEIDEIVSRSSAAVARRPDRRPASIQSDRAPRSTELDSVLDKISTNGIESLTADERRLLDEMSRRLREGDSDRDSQ
ncbi:MAG: rhomboid family intramembrane serine protease [Gemmatimonadota bacterium]